MNNEKCLQLHNAVKRFIYEYAEMYDHVRKNNDWKNSYREIISTEIPNLLKECADIEEPYSVVGSYGKGRWTIVPWIGVFDTRITTSAQKGVYIVYLLNKDSKELYLTLEIAATEVLQTDADEGTSKPFIGIVGNIGSQVADTLKKRATKIREFLSDSYFNTDDKIDSGAIGYNAGAVYYKKYSLDNLVSGEELVADLQRMMDLYQKYFNQMYSSDIGIVTDEWWPTVIEYDPQITKDHWLDLLNNPDIIGPIWGAALAMFYTEKEGATCLTLGKKFNRTPTSISSNCTQIAKRIYAETQCPLSNNGEKEQYWPILFFGREADKTEVGTFLWKLRPELYDALTEFDILRFLPKEVGMEEMPLSTKEIIDKVKAYIAAKGFNYNDGLIENFFLSLKSKPFVILAGTSGTGKTRLGKLFTEAIGAEYKLVPVRPDWSDSTDLFGHLDLNGRFVPGAVIGFIKAALDQPNKPYFLWLDEMNLARVEYYLSDILSIIETRDLIDGKIISDPLFTLDKYGVDVDATKKYGEIRFPQNLYIIGSVNMDETTFPFSKKVLDRANTIEFNYVDLIPNLEPVGEIPERLQLSNSFFCSEYLLLTQCSDDAEYVGSICSELQKINQILQTANAHVGYRVRDEIVFYMLYNKRAGELLPYNNALDNEIMQKILPRIQGSSASVRDMLCTLFKECAADHNQRSGESDSEKMRKVIYDASATCKYRKSAEKIELMVRRFEEDGFTSYWL